jgi:hypothetical protein
MLMLLQACVMHADDMGKALVVTPGQEFVIAGQTHRAKRNASRCAVM